MTDPEEEIESKDQEDLSSILESYFEETEYKVEKFRNNFGIDEKPSGYYHGYDQVAEDFVQRVIDSGDFKELLEFLDKNYGHSTPVKLLEKYFPETPEGTYAVSISEIRDSQISPNPESGLDPTMHKSEYMQILNAINSSGSGIEQAISSFTSLDEEGFRDIILNGLKTAFPKYSAGGEVFNVSGKTDILLKRNNQNLFIAECKIWKGKVQVESTIKQLMDYLTWRDTKTALIFFVQNKDFSSVLEQFPDVIKSHPKCKAFLNKFNENRFDFEFTQNDPNKSFRMAVFCFDFKFPTTKF